MLKNLFFLFLLAFIPAGIAQNLSPEVIQGTKAAYVQNQDYLSTNLSKNYNNPYGDSLRGFNEAAVKADLLSHNVYGKEYQGYITHLKRDFINQKYHPGDAAQQGNIAVASPTSQTAHRPIGSGGNSVNSFPCLNEGFESTPTGTYNTGNAVLGWSISSRSISVCNASNSFTAGSPEFSVMTTPIPSALPFGGALLGGILGNSPLGGNQVVRMNDLTPNFLQTKITQTFPVTSANALFQFAFAGMWCDGGHSCCQQPTFKLLVYNCTGDTLSCLSLSLNATGPGCSPTAATSYSVFQDPGTGTWNWSNWQTDYIDLSPFIGTCVTIDVINNDCIFGGHAGSLFFDAECGTSFVGNGLSTAGASMGSSVSFCSGSNQAQINAPLGYAYYQWYEGNPPQPVTGFGLGGNTPVLTINNPSVGTTYTVQLVTASGCTFVAVDTLTYSTVSIIGLGTTFATCAGGANGSAHRTSQRERNGL